MSPENGAILVEEIAPRLKAVVPHIKTVGCEDGEELYADGLAMAAHMLNGLEARGKQVTPGNIVFYTALHLRSGRRSTGGGRTDAMASSTQLDHSSMMLSLETEVGFDEEVGEPVRLEEMLACTTDDPSQSAGRNIDWEEFLDGSDPRYLCIIHDLAAGHTMLDTARACRIPYHDIR